MLAASHYQLDNLQCARNDLHELHKTEGLAPVAQKLLISLAATKTNVRRTENAMKI